MAFASEQQHEHDVPPSEGGLVDASAGGGCAFEAHFQDQSVVSTFLDQWGIVQTEEGQSAIHENDALLQAALADESLLADLQLSGSQVEGSASFFETPDSFVDDRGSKTRSGRVYSSSVSGSPTSISHGPPSISQSVRTNQHGRRRSSNGSTNLPPLLATFRKQIPASSERRKERNRIAARRSRERRLNYMAELESKLAILYDQNQFLHEREQHLLAYIERLQHSVRNAGVPFEELSLPIMMGDFDIDMAEVTLDNPDETVYVTNESEPFP